MAIFSIDPLRETKPYLEIAARRGAKIKYILESHFHADFVSGHISLAKKTGATIVYGPQATAGYDIHVAKDYENLKLGNATIQVTNHNSIWIRVLFLIIFFLN